MVDYVQDWFSNKYGLKKLAEQQLLKMIASTLKYGKAVIDQAASAGSNVTHHSKEKAGTRRKSVPTLAQAPAVDAEKLKDANYFVMFGRCVHTCVFLRSLLSLTASPSLLH